MHILDIEIIRNLQWPNNNMVLDKENVMKYKRPSAFWISTQLLEKSKKGLITGMDKITRGQVTARWDIISHAMTLRAVVDPRIVGMQKSSVFFSGSLPDISPLSIIESYPDNIDAFHEGLSLRRDGSLESGVKIDIYHKDEKELSRITTDLININPRFKLKSISGFSWSFLSDSNKFKRLRSYDGTLRSGVIAVMNELIKNPTAKINEISTRTGLSRSAIKKIYGDIITSGSLIFEPTMTGKWIGEGASTLVFFTVAESEKRALDSYLMNESVIGKRILLKRDYLKNSLGYLCWVNDFYDAVQFQEAILEKSGRYKPMVVLFPKTIYNTKASINMIVRNSNPSSTATRSGLVEQVAENDEQNPVA
ncbi:MAG: hypothetical protein ACP5NK_04545 [Thermoplasmata archaeon]